MLTTCRRFSMITMFALATSCASGGDEPFADRPRDGGFGGTGALDGDFTGDDAASGDDALLFETDPEEDALPAGDSGAVPPDDAIAPPPPPPPVCGAAAQPCCDGGTCDVGLSCTAGTCQVPAGCGASEQPCCGGSCNPGLVCSGGTCKPPAPCGGVGQECCGGSACNPGLRCSGGRCSRPPPPPRTPCTVRCCSGASHTVAVANQTACSRAYSSCGGKRRTRTIKWGKKTIISRRC